MIFTAITTEDIKSLKQNRPMNLLYIIREVIDIFYTLATSDETLEDSTQISTMKGCINILTRFLPFILDTKTYMEKVLWDGSDISGIKL